MNGSAKGQRREYRGKGFTQNRRGASQLSRVKRDTAAGASAAALCAVFWWQPAGLAARACMPAHHCGRGSMPGSPGMPGIPVMGSPAMPGTAGGGAPGATTAATAGLAPVMGTCCEVQEEGGLCGLQAAAQAAWGGRRCCRLVAKAMPTLTSTRTWSGRAPGPCPAAGTTHSPTWHLNQSNSYTLGFKHTLASPTRLTVDQGDAAEAEGSLGAGATVVMSWMLA